MASRPTSVPASPRVAIRASERSASARPARSTVRHGPALSATSPTSLALAGMLATLLGCRGPAARARAAPPSTPHSARTGGALDPRRTGEAGGQSGARPAPSGARCAVKGYRSPAGARPRLLASVSASRLAIGLLNAGDETVCMWTHVATHETQSDWLRVEYRCGPDLCRIAFQDDRDRSIPVSVEIAPGEVRWVSFDLAEWSLRRGNGRAALPKGPLELTVIYDTREETEVWAGELTARVSMGAR